MAGATTRMSIQLGVDTSDLPAKLNASSGSIKQFSSNVKQSFDSIAVATSAAGQVVASVLSKIGAYLGDKSMAGANFEKSMSRVKALTGASLPEMAALSAEARRLGASTEFSSADAANALSKFAQSGFKVKDMLTALEPTLNLASTGQIGISESAEIVARIMSGMKMPASEVKKTIDILAMASTTAATDIQSLGEAFKFAGPTAKAMGFDIEQTTLLIAKLQDSGAIGEMAGTGVRALVMDMVANNDKAMSVLGVTFKTAAGEMRPIADIVDDVNASLDRMGGFDRMGKLGQVFDKKVASDFVKLLAIGGKELREYDAKLRNAGGTAGRIAATQLDNWLGDMDKLSSAAEGVMESLFVGVAPSLRAATQASGTFFDSVNNRVGKFLPYLDRIGAGVTKVITKATEVLPIVDAWGDTFMAAGEALGRWEFMADILDVFTPNLYRMLEVMADFKEEAMLTAWAFEYGFNNSGKAIDIFNANMAIAGGKIALFATDFKDAFGTTFTYVKEIGEWAVTGLGELFDRMLGNVTVKFKALGDALEKFMKDPTAGWQYKAPTTADYAGSWGDAPKPRDVSTVQDQIIKQGIKDAIKRAEEKAAGLEKGFGQGLFEFIKRKKDAIERGRDGTEFLGFDLKKFIGGKPPPPSGGQAAQGPAALIQGSVVAAQAELKFWRERSGVKSKSIEEKQLEAQKDANKTLKKIEDYVNPSREFGDVFI